ncbi:MAG TPA: ABC transporter permease [Anaerolineales bacterium]|nr:ABC transporter permease [Anaerolineales bacterium]
MKRFHLFVGLLLIFFLTACASDKKYVTITPTVTTPAGPLDGKWQGSGQANGKEYKIFFTVQDSVVTTIQYSFNNSPTTSCLNINHAPIDKARQPHITDHSFSTTLGADLDISAVFKDDASASGHLRGILTRYRRETLCNGSFEVDWTATKQIVQAPVTPPPARQSHPFQTLLQILVFGFSNGAVLALNAIGVTIIYSTVRTLNLAHGDVFALSTVVVTTLVRDLGIQRNWSPLALIASLLIVFCVAIVAGSLLSLGVEEFGFRPFRGSSRFAPVIATLALSFILFQGALIWRTLQPSWIPGEHRSVPGLPEVPTDGIPSLLPEINLVQALHLPLSIVVRFSDVFVLVVALLFVGFASWFLNKTRTGLAIRAFSQNQLLAQILGINVNQTIRRAFMFGGALAGAAAFIFAIYYARPFGQHGAQSGMLAFAAALLGGIGSPLGAMFSGLFIGMVSSLGDYYFSAQWTPVLMLTLLISLLLWKPTGLASDAEASLTVRDSVILTAPAQGHGRNRWLMIALVTLGVLPILFQILNLSGQVILRTVAVYIVLTLGLNLALGIAGLLDFGFALSYGMGAFTMAILSARLGFVPALLCSVFAAMITGGVKGFLGSRLRGDYLAVATLALGLLGSQALINLRSITGGAGGLGNFPGPTFLGINFDTPLEKYYLVFAAVLFAIWISQRLIDSRSGRAWIAISEDEMAATSLGINVVRSRMLAFLLSSALAGLAGALFASTFSFADPDMLAFHVTSIVLTMVILGGAGSTVGVIVGAVIIVLFDKVLVSQLADLVALIWPKNVLVGPTPDIRGANFFNFGIALYLTVLLRARRKNSDRS